MSAIQFAVASNDVLKAIESIQRFHFCILEKFGNPILLGTGKRLTVPLLAFTRMRGSG
jgi:DNA-binding GntR family transcriptional regulator